MIDKAENIKWGSHQLIQHDSADISTSIQRYKECLADGVSLSPWGGFSEQSLDSLRFYPNLKLVVIQGLPDVPLDGLNALSQLEELSIEKTKHSIDFSFFPSLRKLSVDWHEGVFKNIQLARIDSLHVWKYRTSKGDLTSFPEFPFLQYIELVQSTVCSLEGISRFSGLRRLELSYMSKLEKLGKLNLPNLVVFTADNCKKLMDHEELGACLNLEELKLHRCGVMKSVHFVDKLQKLRTFRFMGTDAQDGDLSPLLRLEDVYFTDKRHFSHKTNDMNQDRGG